MGIRACLLLALFFGPAGQAAEGDGAPPLQPAVEESPPLRVEVPYPEEAATAELVHSEGPESGEEPISPLTGPAAGGTGETPSRTDLSAAILGLPDIYQAVLRRAMERTGLFLTCWTKGQMEAGLDLSRYQVLFLHRDLPDSPSRLRPALQTARQRGTKILSLWSAGAYADWVNIPLEDHPYLKGYWDSPSGENLQRFLTYTAVTFLGRRGEVLPPLVPPPNGIYHPDAPQVFRTLADYQKWRPFDPEKPTVAIPFFEFSLSTQNTALLDELIRRLEKDANVLATYGDLPPEFQPDVIVNQRVYGGGLEPEVLKRLNALGIQPIKITSGTAEEWEKGPGLIGGSQVSAWVTVPELNGAVEPLVIGWRKQETDGGVDLPLQERIEKLAQRVASWNRLRRLPNAQKRLAIVHYNSEASYLDVPKSLLRLLRALRERGYSVEVPASEEALLSQLAAAKHVRPGDAAALRRLAAAPSTAKIPVAEYLKWFRGLPEELQHEVIRWWGQPPGRSMVWKGLMLIPQVPLGNVTLVALPSRGESDNPEALYHDLAVPPPHPYIAFYFWLRRGFKADAILHFGTHGTHEFLPRKQMGLSATDWPDLLIQEVPNLYPYMCVNAVEAITARRRGYAVMVSHNVPPLQSTGLSPALEELHRLLRGYERAEGEPLRQEYRRQILAQARRTAAAGVELRDTPDFDRLAPSVHLLLHRLQQEEAPLGLHVLGEQPEGTDLLSTVLSMLHGELEKALTEGNGEAEPEGRVEREIALQLLDAVLRQGLSPEEAQRKVLGQLDGKVTEQLRLALDYAQRIQESDEIGGLLRALEGGYLPSGIGGCPIRNPNVLPTGRNLHAVDPSTIPTKAAWEVGKRMAAELVRQYEQDNGRRPRKVGFVLFGGETIRHEGIVEAQILWLLGVEPVWGGRGGKVVDLRLIPLAELGRPRIDVVVTTTGQYRDVFGEVMALLQKAVAMAAAAKEETNYLRANVQALAQSLQDQGHAPEAAQRLAATRVFAPAVGVYSASLEAAVPATGTWKTEGKLAHFYLERMGFSYGREEGWGEKERGLLAAVLKGTEAAVFSRSSKLYGLLDTDHPFGFLGGMSLAVRHLDGAAPKLSITNLRAANQPLVESAQRFMTMEVYTRYLHPEWIQRMKGAGYSGAGKIANWVHNLWGWQVTDPAAVDPRLWEAAYQVYVRDRYRLGLPQWLRQRRPEALISLCQTLLEAVEHGYWTPAGQVEETLRALATLRFPPPTGGREGTGRGEASFAPIAHPGHGRALPAFFAPRFPAGRGRPGQSQPALPRPPSSTSPVVTGRKMEEVPWPTSWPPVPPRSPIVPALVVIGGLFALGFLRRRKG